MSNFTGRKRPLLQTADDPRVDGAATKIYQSLLPAAERTRVRIYTPDKSVWWFPNQVAEKLGWKKSFELREPLAPPL